MRKLKLIRGLPLIFVTIPLSPRVRHDFRRFSRLLLVGLMLGTLFSGFGGTLVKAGGMKNDSHAEFTYNWEHTDWFPIADLHEKLNDPSSLVMGRVWIKHDDASIHLWVAVYSKQYFAYGEIETFKGSGVLEENKDKYDLHSNGIIIKGLGNPYGNEKDTEGYRWKVDSPLNPPKGKRRDPEITVPSWKDVGEGVPNILTGPILYIAKIPRALAGSGPFTIYIKVHASPPGEIFEFYIPEFPMGTLGAVFAVFLALSIFALNKRYGTLFSLA